MTDINTEEAVLELYKQQEGLTLGLSAIADTLKKMNSRMEAEELRKQLDEEKDKEEKAEAEMKAYIAGVVKQVMELNSDKEAKVGGTDWPMDANPAGEDGEVKAKVRTATSEVQKPIQAMHNKGGMYKDDVVGDEEIVEDGAMEQPTVHDDYPMEEEDERDVPGMAEYKALLNQFQSMSKEMDALKKSIPSMIAKTRDETLAKTGYRVERGLSAPKRIEGSNAPKPLGASPAPIAKSETNGEDVVERLSNLSHNALADIRRKIGWAREAQGVGQDVGLTAEDLHLA